MDMEKVVSCLEDLEQIMITRQEICPSEELQYWIELQEGLAEAITLLKQRDVIIPYIDIDEAKCPDCKVKLTRQELLGGDEMDREKIFDAFRNCITEPKCKDCPWETCEEFHQTKKIPLDLCLDILKLLKEQEAEIERLKTSTVGDNHIPLRW